MCFRSTLSATALALALAMTSSIAKAHDEAKYPNWKGQWRVIQEVRRLVDEWRGFELGRAADPYPGVWS